MIIRKVVIMCISNLVLGIFHFVTNVYLSFGLMYLSYFMYFFDTLCFGYIVGSLLNCPCLHFIVVNRGANNMKRAPAPPPPPPPPGQSISMRS